MSNKKIKVSGYSQRIFYNNGIEYRPFSDDLVGLQSTSLDDSATFTMGNFNVTVNTDSKITKFFNTKKFSNFYDLNTLGIDLIDTENFINKKKLLLKLRRNNLKNFAYFGSMKEYLRVSLEKIIIEWPAGFFSLPIDYNEPTIDNYSYYDFIFDSQTNVSEFKIKKKLIENPFNIIISETSTSNLTNKLRDFSIKYLSYDVNFNNNNFPITYYEDLGDYIKLKVNNNLSSIITNKNKFLIKPNSYEIEKFFKNLNNFESYLLNRDSLPIFTASFDYSSINEFGVTIESNKEVTWPIIDGYNIEFNSENYVDYVTKLIDLTEISDSIDSDVITRSLVANSILEFDTIPSVIGDNEVKEGQKINSLLKIYGRSFDDVKNYIDGIAFAHTVTYEQENNTPDEVLKIIAQTMGWDVLSSPNNNNYIKDFFTLNNIDFSGVTLGKTNIELEYELWRRLILNTPWLWKSKGTRKGIEFLIKFLGIPDGLVLFNEHIYKVESKIDVNEISNILNNISGNTYQLIDLPITLDGYPKIRPNNNEMYFQKAGLWYRETGGLNANVEIYNGNNPHVGKYDGGQEYINQFKDIIPNFLPLTIIKEETIEIINNLFINNNEGEFNILPDNPNVEFLNDDFLDISNYIIYNSYISEKEPKVEVYDDCGCLDTNINGALTIDLDPAPIVNECKYDAFTLGDDGLIIFYNNGYANDATSSECCRKIGFTPELGPNGYYICRWKEIKLTCDDFTPIKPDSELWYFYDNNNQVVTIVPFPECCPSDSIPKLQDGGGYECLIKNNVDPCKDFIPTEFDVEDSVVFNHLNETTIYVPTIECCTNLGFDYQNNSGGIRCLRCKKYANYTIGSDGIVVFQTAENITFSEVNVGTCCPARTSPINEITDNGDILIKCKYTRTGSTTCRYLKSITATPNPTGSLTSIEVSGKYCDGELFSFNFNNGGNTNIHTYELVERCVIEESIEIYPYAPQRVQFEWTTENCNNSDLVQIIDSPIDSGIDNCSSKKIKISGSPGLVVKYIFSTINNGNHGFTNGFSADNGTTFTNNEIIIPNSGFIDVTWNLCARPTLQTGTPNCVAVKLEFKVNNIIIGNLTSTACSDAFN